MSLNWYNAGTDEPRDRNADSALVAHGYWSLGPNGDDTWSAELLEQNEGLYEVISTVQLGIFTSEAAAKAACERYESDPDNQP